MFHFLLMQKIMDNKLKKNPDSNLPEKKKSPKQIIQELSPKSLRREKHTMNRVRSMDNFMKFSWSWTL